MELTLLTLLEFEKKVGQSKRNANVYVGYSADVSLQETQKILGNIFSKVIRMNT